MCFQAKECTHDLHVFFERGPFSPQNIDCHHKPEVPQAITAPIWKGLVWPEQFFSGQRLAFAVAAPMQARVWK